jgi:hypothetical protein
MYGQMYGQIYGQMYAEFNGRTQRTMGTRFALTFGSLLSLCRRNKLFAVASTLFFIKRFAIARLVIEVVCSLAESSF